MSEERVNKIFGVGMVGALISVAAGVSLWVVDRMLGHPQIAAHAAIPRAVGTLLAALGLGIHFWAACTLRNWWLEDRLCTAGPFRFFRHPMYAAWITFVIPGVGLLLNSLTLLLLPAFLHPVWHRLVVREERLMERLFGETYRTYARRTGRFFPRFARPVE